MRGQFEEKIQTCRITPEQDSLFTNIIEKSIYDKARDKMKQGKTKDEEDDTKEAEKDYLAPILKKLNYLDIGKLSPEQAMEVKSEALKRLKERLLTRAEIIQNRLETETKELEQAFVSDLL